MKLIPSYAVFNNKPKMTSLFNLNAENIAQYFLPTSLQSSKYSAGIFEK